MIVDAAATDQGGGKWWKWEVDVDVDVEGQNGTVGRRRAAKVLAGLGRTGQDRVKKAGERQRHGWKQRRLQRLRLSLANDDCRD